MRISLEWLQRYVHFKTSPNELAEKLTLAGLEVEAVEVLGKEFDKFVVGEVVSVRKHPNADRLSICEVKVEEKKNDPDGQAILQIVCGAPNVQAGQKVAVGLVGAIVPKNQHDPQGKPFTLSKVKVRGEESSGMICSSYELGLGNDAEGILVLEQAAKVGIPLAKHLGLDDVVLEIAVTPNRPDCLSHIGIAREVAASLQTKVVFPSAKIVEDKKNNTKDNISIEIKNKKDCLRYTARLITGVTVAPSPQWLQAFLKAVGIRPINNIVDSTNFVMYECGQPLHAFDYDNVRGKKIIVKNAAEGEKFTTLDGVEHALSSAALMICDSERAVAIAGVMGGLNSEISGTTKSVLIESACFHPASIRKTAKQLGISSDASYRFERGIDPNGTAFAADRAAALITEIAGGKVNKSLVDVYPQKIKSRNIRLRISRVNRVLGTDISASETKKILTSIGIKVGAGTKETLACSIPTFRPDIEQEIDLIEEIARLYGFSNIEDKMVTTIDLSHRVSASSNVNGIRASLQGLGFNEVITNSLMEENTANIFSDKVVRIKNPISKDLSALRPSMVGSMLQTVYFNSNYGTNEIKIFEIGRVYEKSGENKHNTIIPGFAEQEILSICLSGKKDPLGWSSDNRKIDIYDMKGVVGALLTKILLDKFHFIYYDSHSALTDETIAIEKNGTYIGFLGKVKAELLKKFSLENDVYVSELNIKELVQGEKKFSNYAPISKFPAISRDLAFIVDESIKSETVESQIRSSGGVLLKKVTLFDVFKGNPLPSDKKSLAFALELNSSERTLTDAEAEKLTKKVVTEVCEKLGAVIRS